MVYTRLWFEVYKRTDNLSFANGEDLVDANISLSKPIKGDLISININRDLNKIIQDGSIPSIPYDDIYKYFSKYDKFIAYIDDDQGNTHVIFKGEISKKGSNWSIDSFDVNFKLLDNLNLLKRINSPYTAKGTSLREYVQNSLQQSGLSGAIEPIFKIGDPILGRFEATGDNLKYLADIKNNYAIMIYGNKDGNLELSTPSYLRNKTGVIDNILTIDVLQSSVSVSIDNLYADVNCIIALGFTSDEDETMAVGFAFDPISFSINGGNINYRIEYAFDIVGGQPELTRFALNKLIEYGKQFKITVSNFPFDHNLDVGRLVKIINHPEINDNQLFLIENISSSLSIDSMFSTINLTGFALGIIPEDILQGDGYSLGILDPNVNVGIGEAFRE